MFKTLGRDELSTKLRARKSLLLCQQHTRATQRKVNRRARPGGAAARYHNVIDLHCSAHLSNVSVPAGAQDQTKRKAPLNAHFCELRFCSQMLQLVWAKAAQD